MRLLHNFEFWISMKKISDIAMEITVSPEAIEVMRRAVEEHNSSLSSPLLSFVRRGKEDISMCEKCYPTISWSSSSGREYQEYMERVMRSGGLSSAPKVATPQEQLVEQLKTLHAKGEDISGIKTGIDRIENEARAEIIGGLKGVAALAKKAAKPAKQFLLTYWHDNEARTLRGIDFAYGEVIEEGDECEKERVFLENSVPGVATYEHWTMKHLEEDLRDNKIPYVVTYID